MVVLLGKDGVQQIYPTAQGGTEFYLNMDDPYKQGSGYSDHGQFNISYGHGSQFPFTKHTQGSLTYFNTEGSPITYASGSKSGRSTRLDVYPDGGKWANKTKYYWKDNPGYLYTDHSISSGEFTLFVRTHGDLGTHQAYACKIGGRDEDDLRSLIEMVYPTASHSDVQVNVNYAHFPYVNCKPKIVNAPPKLVAEKWIGVKCIHIIADDKKSGDWELWYDDAPFASDGKPANNWKLAATYHDVGVKEYGNVPLTWKSHKDLCRIDGFKNVDFTLISDRQITKEAAAAAPAPTPTPPSPSAPSEPGTVTPPPPPAPTQPVEEQEAKIITVTASGDDGNKPSNTLDGNLTTRWSCLGKGSFITFQLSDTYHVTAVAVAWYKGDTRTSNFQISLAMDGNSFSNAFTGTSSKNLSLQKYDLLTQSADAKFVRITVNGNTSNDWASITEAKIYGVLVTPPPTPVPPPPEPTPIPPAPEPTPVPPTPTPESTVDVFGIQKIYADYAGPGVRNNWHLTSASDPRFYEQKPIGPDAKGYYTYPNLTQGRIEVISDTSANESTIPTFNVGKVLDKGYLYKPIDSADGKGDFGDVEITVRYADVKLGSGSWEAHPEIVPGGYRQTNDTKLVGADKAVIAQCEAMSYHSNWYSKTHRLKFERDCMHTGGYTVNSSDPGTTSATVPYEGKADPGVIHKFVLYRVPNAKLRGGYAMKLETWVNESGDGKTFKKGLEFLDNGQWGPTQSDVSKCGCTSYDVMSMGKVAVGIRIDFMQSFKWKDWSIRSIDPSRNLV